MKIIIKHIGSTFPDRVAEWILAAILTSWGLVLLGSQESFQSAPAVFYALGRLASETTWGWVCLMIGGTRLVALIVNGAWVPPTYHLRSITSMLSCGFWFTISAGMFASGVETTGIAVYPWLLVGDLICLYRTARDYRAAMVLTEGRMDAAGS